MPNPFPAEYTVQLGPTVTPVVAGELAAWAALAKTSTSKMTRRVIDAGLEALRADLRAEVGAMPPAVLAEHIEKAEKRGETQVKRRRDYDDRTRTPSAAPAPAKAVKATARRRAAKSVRYSEH